MQNKTECNKMLKVCLRLVIINYRNMLSYIKVLVQGELKWQQGYDGPKEANKTLIAFTA